MGNEENTTLVSKRSETVFCVVQFKHMLRDPAKEHVFSFTEYFFLLRQFCIIWYITCYSIVECNATMAPC